MEPISAAASITGLISLAAEVVKVAYPFVQGVRYAQRDVQELIDELNSLHRTLQELQSFLSSRQHQSPAFAESSLLQTHSNTISTKLAGLYRRLEPISQNKFRRLAWPLQESECKTYITQIPAFTQLIHFALSIDTYKLLSNTSAEVLNTLNSHLQDLKLLGTIKDQLAPLEKALAGQTLLLEDIPLWVAYCMCSVSMCGVGKQLQLTPVNLRWPAQV